MRREQAIALLQLPREAAICRGPYATDLLDGSSPLGPESVVSPQG